jgi:hypothetical protein
LDRIQLTLPDGQHRIEVMAVDMAGNTGSAVVLFTVDTYQPLPAYLGQVSGPVPGSGNPTQGTPSGTVIGSYPEPPRSAPPQTTAWYRENPFDWGWLFGDSTEGWSPPVQQGSGTYHASPANGNITGMLVGFVSRNIMVVLSVVLGIAVLVLIVWLSYR